MKLKLLTPLFVIAFLVLPLSGCNKEPAPKAGPAPNASAPKAPTVMILTKGHCLRSTSQISSQREKNS